MASAVTRSLPRGDPDVGVSFDDPEIGDGLLAFEPVAARNDGVEGNECQMAQALVAAGEAIALFPRPMLQARHPGVAIRPLAADPSMRRVSAIRLTTRYLPPATERFVALLVAASAERADVSSQQS